MNKTANTSAATVVATSRAKTKPAPKVASKVAPVVNAKTEDKTPAAPAPAPAPQAAPAPAPVVAQRKITHAIRESFRPTAGAMLAAHTAVFLRHSGIDKAPMSSRIVREIIGDTAVAYHTRQKNLATVEDQRDPKTDALIRKGGIMLTPQGIAAFASRALNAEFVSAYENVLTRGEADDRVLKNPQGMYQLDATAAK